MATSNPDRSSSPAIDWVGSLSSVPLAEVLRKIALNEASGDLQIHMGSAIKTVYFDHGFVVFAASNLKRDRLGEGLIEAGRISRHEFALASMLMKGSKRKFGEALVQAGVMTEEELGRQVAMQVNRIVLSLFKAKEGVYSFDERGTGIPVDLMVSLSIYRILLEGVRFMSDGKLILSGLPPLNTVVRVSERPPFTLEPRKLKPLEQTILRRAREGAPLASVLQNVDAETGPALRACYGLYAAGLLEPVGEGERPPLKVQEETGHFVLSEIQRKFAKIRATNARQEILMEFDRLDRTNEQELLKIEGAVEGEALHDAYERRLDEWEEKRAMVEAHQTLVAKVDVIRERLRRAYDKMREETLEAREAPDEPRASEREEAPTDAPAPLLEPPSEQTLPPLNEELFDEIGIDVTTPPEAVAIPEELFDPPPSQPFELPGDAAEESEETVTESESEELRGEAEPIPASDADGVVGEAEERPEPERRTAATKLQGAARVERVRQLLRDVKLHFQVRDWEHAVSLLYELVELEPEEAKHHAMLARAMARHPVMRKDAERHFIEALRLKPQDADVHFSLGLYYKSFGMHARAQTEFRTALRINPRHEGATKHLSSGRNAKDPLRDVFKKIFG